MWVLVSEQVCVLVLNCVVKRRRWKALQQVRSELVSAEFLTLRDLPRVRWASRRRSIARAND